MKKILALLLVISLALSFVACGGNNKNDDVEEAENKTTENADGKFGSIKEKHTSPTHTHNFSEATCTEARFCSCGATSGIALGHNYVDNTCSRCGAVDPNSIPVGLDKIYVIDSYEYTYKKGTFTDSFGNTYNDVHLFERLHYVNYGSGAHAMFNLRGEYKKFTGSIVATPETYANQTYYIHIYLDDVLVFTKTGFTKTTGAVDFSIDVTNCEKLSICMGTEGGSASKAEVAIVNAQLTK